MGQQWQGRYVWYPWAHGPRAAWWLYSDCWRYLSMQSLAVAWVCHHTTPLGVMLWQSALHYTVSVKAQTSKPRCTQIGGVMTSIENAIVATLCGQETCLLLV